MALTYFSRSSSRGYESNGDDISVSDHLQSHTDDGALESLQPGIAGPHENHQPQDRLHRTAHSGYFVLPYFFTHVTSDCLKIFLYVSQGIHQGSRL